MKKYFNKNLPKIDHKIRQILPLSVDKKWLKNNISNIDYQINTATWKKSIAEPFYHIFDSKGKRFRPILTCLIHDMLRGNQPDIFELAGISEIIHTGTLIIDDIEDESIMRRGQLCVYQKFGTAIAVNNGNFLYYFAQKIINKSRLSNSQKLFSYQMLTDQLTNLHLGQAMDIWWSQNQKFDVGQDEYMQMTAYKTGALLTFAMQIGAIASGNKFDSGAIHLIARNMGIAFQIRDDILNLKPIVGWGKETGEDITEGKISLLAINTISNANNKDKSKLINILSQKTKQRKLINEAIGLMEKYQSFECASKVAKNLIFDAKQQVAATFNDNQHRKILLEIIDYCINREK